MSNGENSEGSVVSFAECLHAYLFVYEVLQAAR